MKKFIAIIAVNMIWFSAVFAQDIKNTIGKAQPGYVLLSYREGNFTGSGMKEYVTFYKDIKEDEKIKKEPDWAKVIEKVYVYILSKQGIIKSYDLKTSSINEYTDLSNVIKNPIIGLTGWDGYCYTEDLNHNGREDIIFFQLTGMSFIVQIFEYNIKKGVFEKVLEGPPGENLLKMLVKKENDKTIIRLYDRQFDDNGNINDYFTICDYAWNGKKGSYEIIATNNIESMKGE